MATRVKKNIHFLKVLHDSKPKIRKAILQNADKELIDTICECLHNILRGNVVVSPALKRKIHRQRANICQLHSKKCSLKRKKKILIQQGGFLPALLAPILGIVGSLVGGLIK